MLKLTETIIVLALVLAALVIVNSVVKPALVGTTKQTTKQISAPRYCKVCG